MNIHHIKGRRPILAANWKMHMTLVEAEGFMQNLQRDSISPRVEVVICPPFTLLNPLGKMLTGTNLRLGAQNLHWESKGAFTGEISPVMLKDAGVTYVLVGHSERRAHFGEDDAKVGRKVAATLNHQLTPILCVGETLQEREGGRTLEVIKRQLTGALSSLGREFSGEMVIAYEPVWAIGSGRAATGADAQEVASFIRKFYSEQFGEAAATTNLRIQYGGSVKGENIREFTDKPDIEGALVGGASLKPESWYHIIQAVQEQDAC